MEDEYGPVRAAVARRRCTPPSFVRGPFRDRDDG
ncbi:hypothetical protein Rrhod_0692 [Rhodococcus rhodnii LMG 5362]|uniref:Uncharacterized protein n=1 Tax=Rhodococcus rhodnii LMG 5362 TaxID=1273125 RepID=R7WRS5_9NOCA|nr:hypothetical protein Rrhod_0692 [Rhodococcus rhodnii LMG 5362]